jgi:hypothetical protein
MSKQQLTPGGALSAGIPLEPLIHHTLAVQPERQG